MRNKISNIIKRFFALVFICISLAFILNQAFFLHSHIDANGKLVQHAHPYNKASENEKTGKQHSHNLYELMALKSLSLLFIVILSFSFVSYARKVFEIRNTLKFCHCNLYISTIFLRGPPTTC